MLVAEAASAASAYLSSVLLEEKLKLLRLRVVHQRISILGAKLQEVTVEENVAYWNCSDT